MTERIRAALRDLMKDVDQYSVHRDVWERAEAALAEQEEERPPVVTIGALLHPAYEPGDGSADGAQMVGMTWWHPVMGCDSLQIVVDNSRAILARWGHQPAPPAEGEVGELVAWLREEAHYQGSPPEERPSAASRLTRTAELLERQAVAEKSSVAASAPAEGEVQP